MLIIYNGALKLYLTLILVASFFNKKAKQWVEGRRKQVYVNLPESVWFHFASLGEFEQGRPVLDQFRKNYPDDSIVITFFSPSGYEVRKNTMLADAVYYLPLDTKKNAIAFIDAINPRIAVFTKYEYWYYFFKELNSRDIPLYMISAIFRPGQLFFKWYGGLHRKILRLVSHFFVQDKNSADLLTGLGINQVSISGDTRFDRVLANALDPKSVLPAFQFKNKHPLLIAGSTWPEDEKLLVSIVTYYTDWKFIFAPHEISEDKLANLVKWLPPGSTLRYSQINSHTDFNHYQTLIIDNIGMLSSLYQYADMAYIGGGFGAGIHNTLEAAAFGLPVIFGPKYQKFKEAQDLIRIGGAFSINDAQELKLAASKLINLEDRQHLGQKLKDYVREHAGATAIIMAYIAKS
jgi:3-deoxy-D-manno-octulosonic-acid transferase